MRGRYPNFLHSWPRCFPDILEGEEDCSWFQDVLYAQGLRRRLSTWDENDDADQEDAAEGAVNRGDSRDLQHANQCAAELLRTSSLIALGALDSGGQLGAAILSPQWGRLSGHQHCPMAFGCWMFL